MRQTCRFGFHPLKLVCFSFEIFFSLVALLSNSDLGVFGFFLAVLVISLRHDFGHLNVLRGGLHSAFFVVAAVVHGLSKLVEAEVLHLERPLDAVEGIVAQR